jgi:hypothetical protein
MIRSVIDAAVGLAFHAWIPWRARRVQRKFGLDAAWRRRAAAIAHARFADPNDIALFRIETADQLDTYIRRFEDAALNKRINPMGWRAACILADKARFYDRCRAAGLPHPATIAISAAGQLTMVSDPDGRDLIAKPADGEGGDGVRLLGRIADRELLGRALPSGGGGTIVVQERIAIHHDLADIALNALPTVRVVTMLAPDGTPEVVSATIRLASVQGAIVDNMKAGGLLAPVDLEHGTLGLACKGYGGGDYAAHPVTGAAIVGRSVPEWVSVKALAIAAHRAFAEYALIGWDIAVNDAGPVLIEGNGKPGVLMPQRAARAGLGQGRYAELLAHHLAMKP